MKPSNKYTLIMNNDNARQNPVYYIISDGIAALLRDFTEEIKRYGVSKDKVFLPVVLKVCRNEKDIISISGFSEAEVATNAIKAMMKI